MSRYETRRTVAAWGVWDHATHDWALVDRTTARGLTKWEARQTEAMLNLDELSALGQEQDQLEMTTEATTPQNQKETP